MINDIAYINGREAALAEFIKEAATPRLTMRAQQMGGVLPTPKAAPAVPPKPPVAAQPPPLPSQRAAQPANPQPPPLPNQRVAPQTTPGVAPQTTKREPLLPEIPDPRKKKLSPMRKAKRFAKDVGSALQALGIDPQQLIQGQNAQAQAQGAAQSGIMARMGNGLIDAMPGMAAQFALMKMMEPRQDNGY